MDKIKESNEVPGLLWIEPGWPAPANVRAASSTRLGGVSVGPFTSLNLRTIGDDESAAVGENRARLLRAIGAPSEPAWLRQIHGAVALRAPLAESEPQADASFTSEAGVVCVAQTADCLPVLFCDEAGSVVAAAHAGWRGMCAGVLENTVRAMGVAPEKLMAWIGPAIGPTAFEVGAEVREAFIAHDARAAEAFAPGAAPGKFMADLPRLARQRLQHAGLSNIFGDGLCTHSDPAHFFSFRRDGASGRMASLIWLA